MGARRSSNQVRIIAGKWRGRRLLVLDRPGLRPTGDRVRETLFNWLAPMLAGARALDLFAGTGALGLEALSRGASRVVFVDKDASVLAQLIETTRSWPGIDQADFVCEEASQWLALTHEHFDLVFLDPPFVDMQQRALLDQLSPCLAPNAVVYVENPARTALDIQTLPKHWVPLQEKVIGEVHICLLRYDIH